MVAPPPGGANAAELSRMPWTRCADTHRLRPPLEEDSSPETPYHGLSRPARRVTFFLPTQSPTVHGGVRDEGFDESHALGPTILALYHDPCPRCYGRRIGSVGTGCCVRGGTIVVVAAKSLPAVIAGLQAWIMGILAAVATLYLVLAGVFYATAGGDPSQVEKAKSALKNALVGYGLAVLAPVLLSVVKGIVGG